MDLINMGPPDEQDELISYQLITTDELELHYLTDMSINLNTGQIIFNSKLNKNGSQNFKLASDYLITIQMIMNMNLLLFNNSSK